jgi:hypothetical protein
VLPAVLQSARLGLQGQPTALHSSSSPPPPPPPPQALLPAPPLFDARDLRWRQASAADSLPQSALGRTKIAATGKHVLLNAWCAMGRAAVATAQHRPQELPSPLLLWPCLPLATAVPVVSSLVRSALPRSIGLGSGTEGASASQPQSPPRERRRIEQRDRENKAIADAISKTCTSIADDTQWISERLVAATQTSLALQLGVCRGRDAFDHTVLEEKFGFRTPATGPGPWQKLPTPPGQLPLACPAIAALSAWCPFSAVVSALAEAAHALLMTASQAYAGAFESELSEQEHSYKEELRRSELSHSEVVSRIGLFPLHLPEMAKSALLYLLNALPRALSDISAFNSIRTSPLLRAHPFSLSQIEGIVSVAGYGAISGRIATFASTAVFSNDNVAQYGSNILDGFKLLARAYAHLQGSATAFLTFHRLLTAFADLGLVKYFALPISRWAAAFTDVIAESAQSSADGNAIYSTEVPEVDLFRRTLVHISLAKVLSALGAADLGDAAFTLFPRIEMKHLAQLWNMLKTKNAWYLSDLCDEMFRTSQWNEHQERVKTEKPMTPTSTPGPFSPTTPFSLSSMTLRLGGDEQEDSDSDKEGNTSKPADLSLSTAKDPLTPSWDVQIEAVLALLTSLQLCGACQVAASALIKQRAEMLMFSRPEERRVCLEQDEGNLASFPMRSAITDHRWPKGELLEAGRLICVSFHSLRQSFSSPGSTRDSPSVNREYLSAPARCKAVRVEAAMVPEMLADFVDVAAASISLIFAQSTAISREQCETQLCTGDASKEWDQEQWVVVLSSNDRVSLAAAVFPGGSADNNEENTFDEIASHSPFLAVSPATTATTEPFSGVPGSSSIESASMDASMSPENRSPQAYHSKQHFGLSAWKTPKVRLNFEGTAHRMYESTVIASRFKSFQHAHHADEDGSSEGRNSSLRQPAAEDSWLSMRIARSMSAPATITPETMHRIQSAGVFSVLRGNAHLKSGSHVYALTPFPQNKSESFSRFINMPEASVEAARIRVLPSADFDRINTGIESAAKTISAVRRALLLSATGRRGVLRCRSFAISPEECMDRLLRIAGAKVPSFTEKQFPEKYRHMLRRMLDAYGLSEEIASHQPHIDRGFLYDLLSSSSSANWLSSDPPAPPAPLGTFQHPVAQDSEGHFGRRRATNLDDDELQHEIDDLLEELTSDEEGEVKIRADPTVPFVRHTSLGPEAAASEDLHINSGLNGIDAGLGRQRATSTGAVADKETSALASHAASQANYNPLANSLTTPALRTSLRLQTPAVRIPLGTPAAAGVRGPQSLVGMSPNKPFQPTFPVSHSGDAGTAPVINLPGPAAAGVYGIPVELTGSQEQPSEREMRAIWERHRKLAAWLSATHALGRLDRAIIAIQKAREALSSLTMDAYVWDIPEGVVDKDADPCMGRLVGKFEPLGLAPGSVQLFGYRENATVPEKTKNPRVQLSFHNGESDTRIGDEDLHILSGAGKALVSRSAIQNAEFHLGQLVLLEAEARSEGQLWAQLKSEIEQNEATIVGTVNEQATPLGSARGSTDDENYVGVQLVQRASAVAIHCFDWPEQQIDESLRLALMYFERCLGLRGTWFVVLQTYARVLARRALLSFNVCIQASADTVVPKAINVPIAAPPALAKQCDLLSLSPQDLQNALPQLDESKLASVPGGIGTIFSARGQNFAPSFLHSRDAALKLLSVGRMVATMAKTVHEAVQNRGPGAGDDPERLQAMFALEAVDAAVLVRAALVDRRSLLPMSPLTEGNSDAGSTGMVRIVSTGTAAQVSSPVASNSSQTAVPDAPGLDQLYEVATWTHKLVLPTYMPTIIFSSVGSSKRLHEQSTSSSPAASPRLHALDETELDSALRNGLASAGNNSEQKQADRELTIAGLTSLGLATAYRLFSVFDTDKNGVLFGEELLRLWSVCGSWEGASTDPPATRPGPGGDTKSASDPTFFIEDTQSSVSPSETAHFYQLSRSHAATAISAWFRSKFSTSFLGNSDDVFCRLPQRVAYKAKPKVPLSSNSEHSGSPASPLQSDDRDGENEAVPLFTGCEPSAYLTVWMGRRVRPSVNLSAIRSVTFSDPTNEHFTFKSYSYDPSFDACFFVRENELYLAGTIDPVLHRAKRRRRSRAYDERSASYSTVFPRIMERYISTQYLGKAAPLRGKGAGSLFPAQVARRIPCKTARPGTKFGASSDGVAFHTFCEFMSWLAINDPLRLVEALCRFGLLSSGAEVPDAEADTTSLLKIAQELAPASTLAVSGCVTTDASAFKSSILESLRVHERKDDDSMGAFSGDGDGDHLLRNTDMHSSDDEGALSLASEDVNPSSTHSPEGSRTDDLPVDQESAGIDGHASVSKRRRRESCTYLPPGWSVSVLAGNPVGGYDRVLMLAPQPARRSIGHGRRSHLRISHLENGDSSHADAHEFPSGSQSLESDSSSDSGLSGTTGSGDTFHGPSTLRPTASAMGSDGEGFSLSSNTVSSFYTVTTGASGSVHSSEYDTESSHTSNTSNSKSDRQRRGTLPSASASLAPSHASRGQSGTLRSAQTPDKPTTIHSEVPPDASRRHRRELTAASLQSSRESAWPRQASARSFRAVRTVAWSLSGARSLSSRTGTGTAVGDGDWSSKNSDMNTRSGNHTKAAGETQNAGDTATTSRRHQVVDGARHYRSRHRTGGGGDGHNSTSSAGDMTGNGSRRARTNTSSSSLGKVTPGEEHRSTTTSQMSAASSVAPASASQIAHLRAASAGYGVGLMALPSAPTPDDASDPTSLQRRHRAREGTPGGTTLRIADKPAGAPSGASGAGHTIVNASRGIAAALNAADETAVSNFVARVPPALLADPLDMDFDYADDDDDGGVLYPSESENEDPFHSIKKAAHGPDGLPPPPSISVHGQNAIINVPAVSLLGPYGLNIIKKRKAKAQAGDQSGTEDHISIKEVLSERRSDMGKRSFPAPFAASVSSIASQASRTHGLDPLQTRKLLTAMVLEHQHMVRRRRLQRLSTGMHRLFDYFAVVGRGEVHREVDISETRGPMDLRYSPVLYDRLPTADWKDFPLPRGFEHFVFPRGVWLATEPQPPTFFNFVLTFEDGCRLYCTAITRYEKMSPMEFVSSFAVPSDSAPGEVVLAPPPWVDISTINTPNWEFKDVYCPKALVLLSHHSVFSTMRVTLAQILRLSLSPSLPLPLERYIEHTIQDVPLPPRGYTSVGFTLGDKHIITSRPPLNTFPMLDVPLQLLFQCLDCNNLLAVFSAMLCEQHVCLFSKHLSLLTPIAEALQALMFPFRWVASYIPLLTMEGEPLELFEAPQPYFYGWCGDVQDTGLLNAANRSYELLCVDLDRNIVTADARPPKLPDTQRKKLVRLLQKFAYGSGLPSAGVLYGFLGGNRLEPKLYGADVNPDLKARLASLSRAFAAEPGGDLKTSSGSIGDGKTDKGIRNANLTKDVGVGMINGKTYDGIYPVNNFNGSNAMSPLSSNILSNVLPTSSEADADAKVAPNAGMVVLSAAPFPKLHGPWSHQRSREHYAGSLDLASIADRAVALQTKSSAAAEVSASATASANIGTVEKTTSDVLSKLAFGWNWAHEHSASLGMDRTPENSPEKPVPATGAMSTAQQAQKPAGTRSDDKNARADVKSQLSMGRNSLSAAFFSEKVLPLIGEHSRSPLHPVPLSPGISSHAHTKKLHVIPPLDVHIDPILDEGMPRTFTRQPSTGPSSALSNSPGNTQTASLTTGASSNGGTAATSRVAPAPVAIAAGPGASQNASNPNASASASAAPGTPAVEEDVILPTSPITGLTPAFSVPGIRDAFLRFFVSIFKDYQRFVVYRQVGELSDDVAERQIRRLVRKGRHLSSLEYFASGGGLSSGGASASTNHALPKERRSSLIAGEGFNAALGNVNETDPNYLSSSSSTAVAKKEEPAGMESDDGNALQRDPVRVLDSLGVVLPPLPLPALQADFDSNAFLSKHSEARELLNMMLNTQFFQAFKQSLVPVMFQPILHGSYTPIAPRVWDPVKNDVGFYERLPPSLRFFNANINSKLNRLQESRIGKAFRGRSEKRDVRFLEDPSARLRRHIVIAPPTAIRVPINIPAALQMAWGNVMRDAGVDPRQLQNRTRDRAASSASPASVLGVLGPNVATPSASASSISSSLHGTRTRDRAMSEISPSGASRGYGGHAAAAGAEAHPGSFARVRSKSAAVNLSSREEPDRTRDRDRDGDRDRDRNRDRDKGDRGGSRHQVSADSGRQRHRRHKLVEVSGKDGARYRHYHRYRAGRDTARPVPIPLGSPASYQSQSHSSMSGGGSIHRPGPIARNPSAPSALVSAGAGASAAGMLSPSNSGAGAAGPARASSMSLNSVASRPAVGASGAMVGNAMPPGLAGAALAAALGTSDVPNTFGAFPRLRFSSSGAQA